MYTAELSQTLLNVQTCETLKPSGLGGLGVLEELLEVGLHGEHAGAALLHCATTGEEVARHGARIGARRGQNVWRWVSLCSSHVRIMLA